MMKSTLIIAVVVVAMIGVMVPSSFANGIPLDNKEKILEQKIPTWVKSVGIFLVEDKITNDEFDNILKYLIKTEIIFPWNRLQPGILPIFSWIFKNKLPTNEIPDVVISCGRKSVYFSLYLKKLFRKK